MPRKSVSLFGESDAGVIQKLKHSFWGQQHGPPPSSWWLNLVRVGAEGAVAIDVEVFGRRKQVGYNRRLPGSANCSVP